MTKLTNAQKKRTAKARSNCKRALARLKRQSEKDPDNAVTKVLGISRQALWKWDVVPPNRVHIVSQLTAIAPHNLRPDLPSMFPPPKRSRS